MQIRLMCAVAAALLAMTARAAEPAPETVLARKGDLAVTAGDVLASLARLPEDQRFSYRADVQRITSNVSSLFLLRTLAGEARGQGIDKEPEIQRRLRLAEESLLAQVYMERFEKAIATPDFEARAKEIYKADEARFRVPEEVRLQHILVSLQGRTPEEAKRRAEAAHGKLLSGENFARTAREYSNDPTFRNNEGVIQGSYNLLVPEVAAAARTAPLGKPSDLILGSDGYHLIVVNERIPAHVIAFEKAKVGLIDAEKAKYRRAIVEKKLASITQSKEVILYTDEIAALKTEVDRDLLQKMHNEKAQRDREEKERLIREASKQPPGK